MRWVPLIVVLGCSSESRDQPAPAKPAPAEPAPAKPAPAKPAPAEPAPAKPPDPMDERMRHCPVALDGAVSELREIEGGVRFVIAVPEASIEEARRRAHHVVEFAARRTRKGHGEFDGKGGGRMKNCPVVTDGVVITATDLQGGAQLDIVASDGGAGVGQLRAETRARVERFPFVGATINVAR